MAEEVEMEEVYVCTFETCKALATRVIDGSPFCASHRSKHEDAPVVYCEGARGDCGLPAVRRLLGRNLCAVHLPAHCSPLRAA
jgi:hypothetical protein